MSKHQVTVSTYGAGEPARETVRNSRQLATLVAELATITEVDTVHVQIDWSGGHTSNSDGARTAAVARYAGWSYR